MSEEYETDYTNFMVCPHCGHKHRDSWEIFPNSEDGEYDCEECSKRFLWHRLIEITYSTKKP